MKNVNVVPKDQWKYRMAECEIEMNGQEEMTMTEEMFRKQNKKIPNSKARGRDSVQWFWLKKLVQLHENNSDQFSDVLNGSSILPDWMCSNICSHF